MKNSGLFELIGVNNFSPNIHEAISNASKLVNKKQCINCNKSIFQECAHLSKVDKIAMKPVDIAP